MSQGSQNAKHRPNVIFFITDQQQRKTLGCYGNDVIQTPNLDRLAAEGVLCENAFTANVICMPSRATLFTGRYPRVHGVVTNGVALPDEETTLAEVLAAAGYRTAAVGKMHFAPHGETKRDAHGDVLAVSPESPQWHEAGKPVPMPYHGFQQLQMACGHPTDWTDYYQWLVEIDPELPQLWSKDKALQPPSGAPSSWKSGMPEEYHSSTFVGNESIKFLEQFARESEPFFLFASFPDPHFPFCPPAPWCNMYDPADVPMPNRSRAEVEGKPTDYHNRLKKFENAWGYHPLEMPEEHIREIIAHYYGMVSLIDQNVGRVLAKLDELGIAEDTVVIFTTDHGEHAGDHWLIYKCSPYDELTHLPLIWRWPGKFPPGARLEGLVSHLDFMSTVLELVGVEIPRGVQGVSYTEALKQGQGEGRPWVLLEDDDLPLLDEGSYGYLRTLRTRDSRLSYYLNYNDEPDGELYDLRDDPGELNNRWQDPAYRAVREELLQTMLDAVIQAVDPKPERTAPA